jgi:gamma-tubulin complex component 3
VADGVAPGLPLSTRLLVCRLGELGWLYRRISAFLDDASAKVSLGRVAQALCSILQEQLVLYVGCPTALGL